MSARIPTLRGGAAVAAALALIAPWVACQTPLDRAYGKSFHDHVAASTANPEAGKESLEAPHPDGTSTDAALYKFRSEEQKVNKGEEEKSLINVNVGK